MVYFFLSPLTALFPREGRGQGTSCQWSGPFHPGSLMLQVFSAHPRPCWMAWRWVAIPGKQGGLGTSANKADLLQVTSSTRTFFSSEISLLPQFTHCKNQHNLSSGGKGAEFSLFLFFVFLAQVTAQPKVTWRKRGKKKAYSRLPSCKFGNKNQHGHYLKGWGEDRLSALERQERRFHINVLFVLFLLESDLKKCYESQDQGILEFCVLP